MSFNPLADLSTRDVISGGDGPSADGDQQGVAPVPEDDLDQEQIDAEIEDLFLAIKAYAQANELEDSLAITKGEDGRVYVAFNQNVMFGGDSPALLPGGEEILLDVCGLLDEHADAIEEVRIQGHTARYVYNQPNPVKGDWELSSDRARNVQFFIYENTTKIHPSRLVTESFGQWRPKGDNRTAEGMTINRRVEMIISGRNIEEELAGNSIGQLYIDMLD